MEIILLMIIIMAILFYIMSASAANIMMIMKYGADWNGKQRRSNDSSIILLLLTFLIFVIGFLFKFLVTIYKFLLKQKYLVVIISILLLGIGINIYINKDKVTIMVATLYHQADKIIIDGKHYNNPTFDEHDFSQANYRDVPAVFDDYKEINFFKSGEKSIFIHELKVSKGEHIIEAVMTDKGDLFKSGEKSILVKKDFSEPIFFNLRKESHKFSLQKYPKHTPLTIEWYKFIDTNSRSFENTYISFVTRLTNNTYIMAIKTGSIGNSNTLLFNLDSNGSYLHVSGYWRREAASIIFEKDNTFLITGSAGDVGSDFWAAKFDNNISRYWNKTYGRYAKYGKYGRDAKVRERLNETIVANNNDGYILIGTAAHIKENNIYSRYYNSNDIWVVKIDKNGNKLWDKIFEGEGSYQSVSIVADKGNGYVIGATMKVKDEKFNEVVRNISFKISDDGTLVNDHLILKKNYSFTPNSFSSIHNIDGFTLSSSGGDILVSETDDKGHVIWSKAFGSKDYLSIHSIIQSKDNGYFLLGNKKHDYSPNPEKVFIMKLRRTKVNVE